VAITLFTVKLAVPVLLSVIGTPALVEPTGTPLKLILAGVSVAIGATPVPLIATLWGLPLPLSVIFTADDRLPVLVGMKITLMVQLAFTAKDEGQVLVSEKSPALALDILTLVIDNDTVPVLVSVITWAALPTPTCWLPKLKLVGARVTGWAAAKVENDITASTPILRRGFSILEDGAWALHERGMLSYCSYCALPECLNPEKSFRFFTVCKFLHDLEALNRSASTAGAPKRRQRSPEER
jgi:hypothetical protein